MRDDLPTAARVSDPGIRALYRLENRWQAWLDVEVALARAQAELGPEYETLLGLLSEAREELRSSGASSEDADWQRVLDSGILDLVRAGRIDEAKELLRTCL